MAAGHRCTRLGRRALAWGYRRLALGAVTAGPAKRGAGVAPRNGDLPLRTYPRDVATAAESERVTAARAPK